MTVTMLTHQMIAREAAAMLDEEMPFSTRVNRGREEEFVNAVNGYKKGDTVSIKVPGTSTVYNSAIFAAGGTIDVYTETPVSLTLDTQQHTGLTFTAKERALEIGDFKERVLLPKVRSLASVVEADLILRAQKLTPNTVGTAGVTPTTAKTFGAARQKLQMYLAPPGDRTLLISTEANLEMVDASKALFNPAPSIAKMYSEGHMMGMFQGAATFETANLQPYGNVADIVMTVNGASQTGATLTVAGAPGSPFLNNGMVFTLPGVFAVHPLTGVATTTLQQFTVTGSTATTITVSPPITTSFPNKTVSASPTDTDALTFVGAASTTYVRSFMFEKNAFTVAFAPLAVLPGTEGYTAMMNGMSVRVMSGGNFDNDTQSTRMDVLYGIAGVRTLHACNVLQ
jgi:hypothetical protein